MNTKQSFYQAQMLQNLKQFQKAIDMFELILIKEDFGEIYENSLLSSAECYFEIWNYQKALQNYRTYLWQAQKIASRDHIMYRLWECYIQQNSDKNALNHFKYIIQEYPDSQYYEKAKSKLNKI